MHKPMLGKLLLATILLAGCSANGGNPSLGLGGNGAAADSDGDGVANAADLCPGTAQGASVDADGCAAGQVPEDQDGDGVPDANDLCPGTAEGASVDADGCSAGQIPEDQDGDGVPNSTDLCPGTAAGATVDADGCSAEQVPADQDGDGVVDDADLCPDTPAGQPVNAFGCTDEQTAAGPIGLDGGYRCASRSAGVTSSSASGNLCELGMILDPITGLLTGSPACYVSDEELVVDQDPTTYAQMGIDLAVLDLGSGIDPLDANVTLQVDLPGQQPGGGVAAFEIEVPGGTVEAGVLPDVTIRTYLNGTLVDTASTDVSIDGFGLLTLDLLEAGLDNQRLLAGFLASAPFNAIDIKVSATIAEADLGVLDPNNDAALWVYDVCAGAVYAP